MPTPTEIVDQPIALLDGSHTAASGVDTTQPSTETVYVPTTQVDKVFPPKIIAHETLSQSLNTESRSILGIYSFESMGALAIGTFQQGVSGEIKISPDGIVARNINGDITFALDGATGDAVFKGTITTGAIISGLVEVGDNSLILDGASKSIYVNDGVNYIIHIGYAAGRY